MDLGLAGSRFRLTLLFRRSLALLRRAAGKEIRDMMNISRHSAKGRVVRILRTLQDRSARTEPHGVHKNKVN